MIELFYTVIRPFTFAVVASYQCFISHALSSIDPKIRHRSEEMVPVSQPEILLSDVIICCCCPPFVWVALLLLFAWVLQAWLSLEVYQVLLPQAA